MEFFVHLDPVGLVAPLVAIAAEIPAALKIAGIDAGELPRNWRALPAAPRFRERGRNWILEERSAVLRVPSALIPGESNYLLNPAHRDFPRIKIHAPEPFGFDPRMWKATSS